MHRRFVALAGITGLLFAGAVGLAGPSAVTASDPTPAPYFVPADDYPAGECTPLTLTLTQYIEPDGTIAASYQPGDGQLLTYDDGAGGTITQTLPPEGFQPIASTDAQLAMYNFPARPTDADALAEWNAEYTGFNGYYTSTPCLDASWRSTPVAYDPNTLRSPTASGEIIVDHTYNLLRSWLRVPTYTNASCSSTAQEGHWQGFQDLQATKLTQDGVHGHNNHSAGVDLFYEEINGAANYGPYDLASENHPGTRILTLMAYAGNGQMSYWFYNADTHREYASVQVSAHGAYSGESALYIVERPTAAGGPVPLRDFSQTIIGHQQLRWTNSGGGYTYGNPGTENTQLIDMYNGAHKLAYVSSSGATNFTDVWHMCS